MDPKTLRRLTLVLVALGAATILAAFLTRQKRAPALAPESLPARVTRLELEGPRGKLRLTKEKGAWVAAAPAGYPADAALVAEALERTSQATLSEPVTEDAQRYPMFGLGAESATHVQLEGEKGSLLEFYVGKDGPDYPSAFLRISGQTGVVRGDGMSAADWSRAPGAWLDKRVTTGMAESVTSVAVRGPKGAWELKRSSGGWTLAGQPLPQGSVDGPVRQAREAAGNLEADSVLDAAAAPKDMGLDKPDLRVSAATKTGPVAFIVGKKDAEGRRYVRKEGEARVVFLVGDWKLDALRKSVADFFKK